MQKFIVTLEVYDDDRHTDQRAVWELVYNSLGSDFPLAFEMRVDSEAERLDRAKGAARKMLGGLMPGNTGNNMADEVAEKVVAAIDSRGV